MEKDNKIKEIVGELREKLIKLYGDRLNKVIIYGSWARGEATEESDIDLLIVLKGKVIPGKEIDRMIDIITEINLKHSVLLSIYPVSEVNYSRVNSPLLINVRRRNTCMKEIISLIERSKKYLKSSEILLKEKDYESSVSRTYYAMFYSAQAILLTKNLSFSSHKGVISAFGEHFIKTGSFSKEMGRELNRAFEKRQIGDYEYTFVISKEEAKEMLENGKKFVKQISWYLKEKKIL